MKVVILQEKLKEGLLITERICSKSSTLPILNNILLKAEKNFLEIRSTDLEIGIKWRSLAKIEEEGEIVVPSKILTSFVSFLPLKQITLSTKDLFLEVESDNYKTKIKCFNSSEFPILPSISESDSVILDIQNFISGIKAVIDLPSVSSAKPEISGLYFLFQKDLVIIAATDSFRLGEKKIFLEKPTSLTKEYSFILPQKTAKELINIFGDKEGEIKIYFNPNQVFFEFLMEEIPQPKIQLISRLIEGEYPNYQEIIPKKYETQIFFSKNELLNQIKLASLFSGKTNEVKLKIIPKENKVEIFSQNPDFGEYRSCLKGQVKGEALEISFNHKFLIEGLSNIKDPEVFFELNGEDRPAVLKPADDQSYIYIVMPIKLS